MSGASSAARPPQTSTRMAARGAANPWTLSGDTRHPSVMMSACTIQLEPDMNNDDLIKAFRADYPFAQVRGAKLSRTIRAQELRTKKNNHLAAVWDELGNVFVLRADGYRVQLHPDEYWSPS